MLAACTACGSTSSSPSRSSISSFFSRLFDACKRRKLKWNSVTDVAPHSPFSPWCEAGNNICYIKWLIVGCQLDRMERNIRPTRRTCPTIHSSCMHATFEIHVNSASQFGVQPHQSKSLWRQHVGCLPEWHSPRACQCGLWPCASMCITCATRRRPHTNCRNKHEYTMTQQGTHTHIGRREVGVLCALT